jgi:hypothetical protein
MSSFIVNRDGRPFCSKCMETVPDVIKHLRIHGVRKGPSAASPPPPPKPKPEWGSKEKPCPPDLLAHEDLLEGLLKKVSAHVEGSYPNIIWCNKFPDNAYYLVDSWNQEKCDECLDTGDAIRKWYVDYADIRRKYGF